MLGVYNLLLWYPGGMLGVYNLLWYPGGMLGVYNPPMCVPGRHAGCV